MRQGFVNSKMPYMTVDEQRQLIWDYVKSNHHILTSQEIPNSFPINSKKGLTAINDGADEIFALKAQGMSSLQVAAQIGCGTTSLYKFYKQQRETKAMPQLTAT